jgi:hypothetical protein
VGKNDPRYTSGKLKHILSGRVPVRNEDGDVFNVDVDDIHYKDGKYKHISTGTIMIKYKSGGVGRISLDAYDSTLH